MYIEFVITLYFWVLLLCLFTTKANSINRLNYCICFILFFLVAGLRPAFSDRDNELYRNAWNYAFYGAVIESSFVFIRDILKFYLKLPVTSLFITYALLGVSTKFFGIRRLTDLFFLSLLAYLSHYFILHDMTQIRASIASGIFLLSIPFIYKRELIKYILIISVACLFHYSSFFLFFLYFINPSKKQRFYLYLIPIGYVLYFAGANIIVSIPIPYFQDKMDLYKEGVESGDKKDTTINVFNAFIILKVFVFYLIYIFQDKILHKNKYTTLILKINAISLASLPALSIIPAIAYRVHELFGIVEIIMLPLIVYIFKNKFVGYMIVIIYTLAFLLINIFYNELIINP